MKTLSCWFSSVSRETVGFLVCCASHWWCHQAASGPSQSVFTLGLWLHTLAALDPKWVFYGREGRADGVALWRSLPFGGLRSRAVQVTSEEEGQWLFLASLLLFLLHLNPSNMGPLSFWYKMPRERSLLSGSSSLVSTAKVTFILAYVSGFFRWTSWS